MASTLRVNLSAVGQGCQDDPTPAGRFPAAGNYVFLLNCNGSPVVKAGRNLFASFDHGYAELSDVDPGKYLLLVMANPFATGGGNFQSNMVAFHAIDVCSCCDTLCFRIYQTGWHQCFNINVLVLQNLQRAGILAPDLVDRAVGALQEAMKVQTPLPTDAAAEREIARIQAAFLEGAKPASA